MLALLEVGGTVRFFGPVNICVFIPFTSLYFILVFKGRYWPRKVFQMFGYPLASCSVFWPYHRQFLSIRSIMGPRNLIQG